MIRARRIVRDIAMLAMVFQVVHFVEHGAQLAYWFANPTEAPWLTPWAVAGRDLLAVDGTPTGGNEVLHLVGNLIFLGGLVSLVYLAVRAGRGLEGFRHLRRATAMQTAHVLEHLLLTGSYLIWGSAIGFTTLFGSAQGVIGSSLRIWAHFLLNLGATYLALRALWEMHQLGLIVEPHPRNRLEPVVSSSARPTKPSVRR